MEYKIDFDSLPWVSPLAGVRCKVFQSDRQVRLVEYGREFEEPGWCTKGHTGYVIEGEFTIEFDGTAVSFGPGDVLHIPAGERHRHRAHILSEKVRIVLVEDI